MNNQAELIRTWDLRASSRTYTPCAAALESNGPSMTAGEHVEVIELEAVLDILEKARLLFPELDGTNLPKSALETEIEELEPVIENLLREHGRLQ